MEQNGEKSQDPTPHRRQQAREKGEVARSQDLSAAIVLVGALLVLSILGREVANFLGQFAVDHFGGPAWLRADAPFAVQQWNKTLSDAAGVLLPVMLLVMVVSVAASVMQVGLMFVPEKLVPDIKRLDVIKAFGRLFSLPALMRLAFGLFKILIVGSVAYAVLFGRLEEILGLTEMPVEQLCIFLLEILFWTTMYIGGALLVLALLDYGFQWWKHEQDLRMTTQEVREEMKNLQGDPQIISRRRQVQRQLVLNRLSSTVPQADVVVTNPTELAIALKYDPLAMQAPVVVAKGAGVLAQRIRRIALEHGIPIVEKKPLAQAMYKEVDVNHPIPSRMYATVAEIMAYVYRLKGKAPPKLAG